MTNLLSNALKYGRCKPIEIEAGTQGDSAVVRAGLSTSLGSNGGSLARVATGMAGATGTALSRDTLGTVRDSPAGTVCSRGRASADR